MIILHPTACITGVRTDAGGWGALLEDEPVPSQAALGKFLADRFETLTGSKVATQEDADSDNAAYDVITDENGVSPDNRHFVSDPTQGALLETALESYTVHMNGNICLSNEDDSINVLLTHGDAEAFMRLMRTDIERSIEKLRTALARF